MDILAKLLLSLALLAAIVLFRAVPASSHEVGGHEKVTPPFQRRLPITPGKSLAAVVVSYAPGQSSAIHRHAGRVFAYVLLGSIKSENSATGPARIYEVGESFSEPPESEHLICENANETESATLIAVVVVDEVAVPTVASR